MQIKFASIAAAGLLAFILSGCGSAPAKSADAAPAKAAEPALTPEAQQAMAAAEADWKKAKAEFALWTTTDKAFKDAQSAAKAGDSAAVLKLSQKVSGMVKIAMEQKNYPSTEMK
ncbi:MAG: hypothetical protein H6935_02515 [Thiobacillus sp.]|nr:hypothetical protein [Thiobacillus sp.]